MQTNKFINKYTLVVLCALLIFLFHTSMDYAHGVHLSKPRIAKMDIEYFDRVLNDLRNDIGRLPTTEEGLSMLLRSKVIDPNWKGPYFQRSLNDPWGKEYIYLYPAKYGDKNFDLYSTGADRKDDFGEKDDIANWDWEENYLNYYKGLTGSQKSFLYLAVTIFFSIISLIFIKAGNPSMSSIAFRFTLLTFASPFFLIVLFMTLLSTEFFTFITLELAYTLVFSICFTMILMGVISSSIIIIRQGFKLSLAAQWILNMFIFGVMMVIMQIYFID